MNGPKFWKIIEDAHAQANDNMAKKCEAIKEEIAKLSKSDALAFSRLFDTMMDRAYTWGLWTAAQIIAGSCSGKHFSDFRASLISRGSRTLEKAIVDPDSLAEEELDKTTWFYAGYEHSIFDSLTSILGKLPDREKPFQREPYGEPCSLVDIEMRYPKLAKKFSFSDAIMSEVNGLHTSPAILGIGSS